MADDTRGYFRPPFTEVPNINGISSLHLHALCHSSFVFLHPAFGTQRTAAEQRRTEQTETERKFSQGKDTVGTHPSEVL